MKTFTLNNRFNFEVDETAPQVKITDLANGSQSAFANCCTEPLIALINEYLELKFMYEGLKK